jgi:hypothetical protein
MKGCCEGVNLLKVAYAILDKKGRVVVDDLDALLVYKTKIAAQNNLLEDDATETVQKISIIAA